MYPSVEISNNIPYPPEFRTPVEKPKVIFGEAHIRLAERPSDYDDVLHIIERQFQLQTKNPKLSRYFPHDHLEPTIEHYKKTLGNIYDRYPMYGRLLVATAPILEWKGRGDRSKLVPTGENRTVGSIALQTQIQGFLRSWYAENAGVKPLIGSVHEMLEDGYAWQLSTLFKDPEYHHPQDAPLLGDDLIYHGTRWAQDMRAEGLVYFSTWPGGRRKMNEMPFAKRVGTLQKPPHPFETRVADIGFIDLSQNIILPNRQK